MKDPIVVISCAKGKKVKAGDLQGSLKDKNGTPIVFVAHPKEAPDNPTCVYAHPDDPSDYGMPWRAKLLDYNQKHQDTGDNPDGLLPAWRLYRNEAYSSLVGHYGISRVYILSAGWGLIKSTFLLSYYDITFSTDEGVDEWVRRDYKKNGGDGFSDFTHLSKPDEDLNEPIVFFGEDYYVQPFIDLTQELKCQKVIYFESERKRKPFLQYPSAYDLRVDYGSKPKEERWYYQCAKDFIEGKIHL